MYEISFIGAGNLAWHLAPAFEAAGCLVRHVFSRQKQQALHLCERLYEASPTTSLDFSNSNTQLFVLCVRDDALSQVVEQLVLPNVHDLLVVHTSGSQPMQVLAELGVEHGVFYPLQTFSKQKYIHWQEVPICIEGSSSQVNQRLRQLAQRISKKVYTLSSPQRQSLHIAAVFACNFTNHMLAIAQRLCMQNGLSFELLHPLIRETIEKAITLDPIQAQTGPAARGDTELIQQHLHKLAGQPMMQQIYQLISASIQQLEA